LLTWSFWNSKCNTISSPYQIFYEVIPTDQYPTVWQTTKASVEFLNNEQFIFLLLNLSCRKSPQRGQNLPGMNHTKLIIHTHAQYHVLIQYAQSVFYLKQHFGLNMVTIFWNCIVNHNIENWLVFLIFFLWIIPFRHHQANEPTISITKYCIINKNHKHLLLAIYVSTFFLPYLGIKQSTI